MSKKVYIKKPRRPIIGSTGSDIPLEAYFYEAKEGPLKPIGATGNFSLPKPPLKFYDAEEGDLSNFPIPFKMPESSKKMLKTNTGKDNYLKSSYDTLITGLSQPTMSENKPLTWLEHVKQCRSKNPNMSYKEALKFCKESYTKKEKVKKVKIDKQSTKTKLNKMSSMALKKLAEEKGVNIFQMHTGGPKVGQIRKNAKGQNLYLTKKEIINLMKDMTL
jgi:pyruvate/2-oxoglutarate dehydrogenase complex dihydrolipoamide acyltransferase (E2) component